MSAGPSAWRYCSPVNSKPVPPHSPLGSLNDLIPGGAVILFRAIYRFLEICIKHRHSNGNTSYPLSEHE